jgi:UPF0755 protein
MAERKPKQPIAKRRKYLLWLIALALGVVLALYLVLLLPNQTPGIPAKPVQLIVPKGASLHDIADSLSTHGLIRSGLTFKLAGKLLGSATKIKAGSYLIAYGLTNTAILSRLTGKEYAIAFDVTIPEGSHIRKIASIAQARLNLDSARIVRLSHDTAFLNTLDLPKGATTAEGYLFPDTYRFYLSLTPEELLQRMHARWREVMHDSLRTRARVLGLSEHELMTLASIVEGEAQASEERDTIAGLYWNRLRRGMKLDADPTVKYGLGLDHPITARELRIDNVYNTYLHPGLPPGPINNPGLAAIKATLYPAKHNKIYFVSRGDGSGRHYFSTTIQEQQYWISVSNRNSRLP